MTPLETYLTELRDLRSTGATVKETSFYGPLAVFLNALGTSLKPRVRCVVNIANIGAGIPDVGLFTQDQFQNRSAHDPLPGQLPARGVLEVKGTSADVEKIAASEQVTKYLNRYGVVLVTNYRDFLLVSRDPAGRDVWQERYTLAAKESEFWNSLHEPVRFARKHQVPLEELLKRVLLHNAPISQPRDIAWFLASYARDAKDRVENTPLREMDAIREAIEQVLGIHFQDEKSQHFFRSTLVQTLFYGVFSSYVLWHRQNLPIRLTDRFDWKTAAFSLQVPIVSALFHEIANPLRLQPLGIDKILDWTEGALNRVDRARFFSQFDEGDAVQYFYEPFLEAFDPDLRKELGVWYTPREIVRYQVERIDRLLRSELGIIDGLADSNVYVLDPCCGTGAYLVEVLHRIEKTLRGKGDEAFIGSDLKQAAVERVIGFEILPAPFVVAHLQIGMLLQKTGAEIGGSERAAIFLTNALTGWEPPTEEVKKRLRQLEIHFPEFRKERDAADSVKSSKRILVVLGNPPYNAFAGTSPEEEEDLVEAYKGVYRDNAGRRRSRLNDPATMGGWGIKKFNLDDLYIRFFRIAERCIAEIGGAGIVSYISNFSYLSEPSYVVMRERLLREFDQLWFDCLNGDSRETGKVTPDGKADPSIFSTEFNREGIRKGTAICVLIRKRPRQVNAHPVLYRDFWGSEKREELESTLENTENVKPFIPASPTVANRLSFRPEIVAPSYLAWPRLSDLSGLCLNGLMEKRGGALIDMERQSLERRMRAYYDPKMDWTAWKASGEGLAVDAARFNAAAARKKVLQIETFSENKMTRYAIRPMDTQFCYYTGVRPIWNEPRPALYEQFRLGNTFLISRPKGVASPEGVPFSLCRVLGDNDYLKGHAYYFPFTIHSANQAEAESNQGAYSA